MSSLPYFSMKASYELHQESLNSLLLLLSPDRDEAGRKYETVRAGLIRFFRSRGCDDAEELADETINRVAKKASLFDSGKGRQTTSYFCGFATRVLFEYRRSGRSHETGLPPDRLKDDEPDESLDRDRHESQLDCLGGCLEMLSDDDRELLLEYYTLERQAKIDMRKRMAKRLGFDTAQLYGRVFRIRSRVKKCISRCIEEKVAKKSR